MINIKAIHQFTPTVTFGDSVSNGVLFTQKLLQDMGFESNIYVCTNPIDIKFAHEVYHISQYQQSSENLLFYHHSIGHICHENIMDFLDKKVLIYHNITPSHFFKNEQYLQVACNKGREQLRDSVSSFVGSFADSKYNCKELKYYDYTNPIVLPILMDLDKKVSVIANEKIVQKYANTYNILFIGRVVQNKCQHQLIDVMLQLKERDVQNVKLFIVGGVSQPEYFNYINNYSKNLGLSLNVVITNKVSDEDLAAYYKNADLYLSLSEHEGFGMPLIEAIKYDIPVLAYNAGGISSTVVKDGLLEAKASNFVADKIIQLQNDPYFRVELLKKQKQHLESFSNENIQQRLENFLTGIGIIIKSNLSPKKITTKKSIQVQGPFDSSYSLSIVNNTISKALYYNTDSDISLYSTEGNGDFQANLDNLDEITKKLAQKKVDNIDISIRNLYPPRTNAMKGYHKIIGPYGWEESKFPQKYVNDFNTKLSMVFTMSSYVSKLLADNGVFTPLKTTGLVVENILNIDSNPLAYVLPTGFRLLHISSAFPRKGLSQLLSVFNDLNKSFSLIIKTFVNPHNNTIHELEELDFKVSKIYEENITLYEKDDKQILLINKDLTQENIKYLYENSNLLVAPSCGEGFGLPMAEAMLLNLPVLTTAYGGQSDFCTPKTSWLIDFDFTYAATHMNLKNSLWAVPKVSSLKEEILNISLLSKEKLEQKTKLAKEYILQNYSSKNIARNITNAIDNYPVKKPQQNIALFSTYNTKCGIAQYSKYLISSFYDDVSIFANITNDIRIAKDFKNITRCWDDGRNVNNIDSLKQQLLNKNITRFIIQYNFSFIPLSLLEELLLFCDEQEIQTYLFLHSTKDVIDESYTDSFSSITRALLKVTSIYVHTLKDINQLKDFGIYKNTTLFTHGINYSPLQSENISKNTLEITNDYIPTIATFGFLLPQKGILELVDIAEELHARGKKVYLLLLTSLHSVSVSKTLEEKLRHKIANSSIREYITLTVSYLQEDQIIQRLSKVDKLLFFYKDTQESSSAAVRMGLLAQKEVITTPIPIFNDVKEVVTQTKNSSQDEIIKTILYSLSKDYDNTKHKEFLKQSSWHTISKRFKSTLESIIKY